MDGEVEGRRKEGAGSGSSEFPSAGCVQASAGGPSGRGAPERISPPGRRLH